MENTFCGDIHRVLVKILVQKGGTFALIFISHLISITIEKVQNEVMVNML